MTQLGSTPAYLLCPERHMQWLHPDTNRLNTGTPSQVKGPGQRPGHAGYRKTASGPRNPYPDIRRLCLGCCDRSFTSRN